MSFCFRSTHASAAQGVACLLLRTCGELQACHAPGSDWRCDMCAASEIACMCFCEGVGSFLGSGGYAYQAAGFKTSRSRRRRVIVLQEWSGEGQGAGFQDMVAGCAWIGGLAGMPCCIVAELNGACLTHFCTAAW